MKYLKNTDVSYYLGVFCFSVYGLIFSLFTTVTPLFFIITIIGWSIAFLITISENKRQYKKDFLKLSREEFKRKWDLKTV